MIVKSVCAVYDDNFNEGSDLIKKWFAESEKNDAFCASVACNVSSINLIRCGDYEQAREIQLVGAKVER